jgi:hypothetical protein
MRVSSEQLHFRPRDSAQRVGKELMSKKIKTIVTFTSLLFNTSSQKAYFINPGCFGDDVAKWLADQLRNQGHEDMPGQEDFGWYFIFQM